MVLNVGEAFKIKILFRKEEKKMKKILALLMAVVMLFTLAACGGNTDDTKAQSLAVCLASEPDTLDPALNSAVDGATLVAHLFSGLAKWAQDETGKLVIVADAAEELVEGVENEDGTVTYTYTLKEGLTWSDGQPLKASDFVFSWNRAASPALAADYNYMLDVVKGYAEMWETKETGEVDGEGNPVEEFVNPDAKLAVEATDDRTLVVTINNAVAYWNELLAFPTYYPVREDVVASENWQPIPLHTYVTVLTPSQAGSTTVLSLSQRTISTSMLKRLQCLKSSSIFPTMLTICSPTTRTATGFLSTMFPQMTSLLLRQNILKNS